MSRSSFLLTDLYIPREAPLSDLFERLPRLAASAAPAAICCFFDFAGIQRNFARRSGNGFVSARGAFAPQKVNRHAAEHDQNSDSGRSRRKERKIDNQQS